MAERLRSPLRSAVRCGFISIPLSEPLEQIKVGKLRALGVTTTARVGALPDAPSISGFVPGYEASWQGIGAPKDTPDEIVDKLNHEVSTVLADPR